MSSIHPVNGKVLLSHPTGNSNTRAAAEALHRQALLDSFHTCIAVGKGAKNPLRKKLYAQRETALPDSLIQTYPCRELLRLLSEKTGLFPQLRKHETGPLCVDRIYRQLDAAVARHLEGRNEGSVAGVYAYEDGALSTFQVAGKKNLHRFYDLPIGYWRAARNIQSEEAERRPEWKDTMPALIDSEEKLLRKDAELQEADTIIVASQFTAHTLKQAPFPVSKTFVIPYACPEVQVPISGKRRAGEKLRVLFVGSLSQRKGLADLLDAVAMTANAVELTIIGRKVGPCKPLDAALGQHRWIESLPHTEILRTMREHDVLVFPSLFEGFGLVVTEALAQGIPVIATDHTCAPDIIRDGREGFIVPIRDPEAIAAKLAHLHDNDELLQQMKENALQTAAKRTPERYAGQLVECVTSRLQS